MVDYELVKNKEWRKLFDRMEKGEEVFFKAESEDEIRSIRTSAAKWNFLRESPYAIGVETNGLKVALYTKPKIMK